MSILHSEPQYKIRDTVEEFLGRSRLVIRDMGLTLERLLRAMIAAFGAFQERHDLATLDGVRFEWIRWTNHGDLVIEFSVGQARPPADHEDRPRHVVIDAFVDDVVGRTVPESLREEFAGFLRGLVVQFGLLAKHNQMALRRVAFGRPAWSGDRVLTMAVTHHGRPFTPGLVRID